MESSEVTDIVRICSDLIARYTHFADLGEIQRVPELFTEDGVWATPTEQHEGQEALRKRFESSVGLQRITRHVCTNVLVNVLSAEEATATVYLTLYRHDGPVDGPAPISGPVKMGQYRDRLVKTAEGWRFAERRCTFAFA
jgi:ketosteroid isomerase-like protein